jgi:hypothetical protein
MVAAGKYLATIKAYGVSETQSGKPRVEIQFGFKDQAGLEQTLYWYGYVTEKALAITARALVNCGLTGTDYDALSKGAESGMLNMEKPVEIDVQHETFEGKTHPKIAWVNRPRGAQFMDPKMGATKLKGINFGAAVAAARAETGIKDDDKIPF